MLKLLCKPEVDHLDVALTIDENILWLKVWVADKRFKRADQKKAGHLGGALEKRFNERGE